MNRANKKSQESFVKRERRTFRVCFSPPSLSQMLIHVDGMEWKEWWREKGVNDGSGEK